MDDRVWEALTQLDTANLVSLVDEAGGKLASGSLRNVNAFMMVRPRGVGCAPSQALPGKGRGALSA
jgi:hypothetical protein